MTTSLQQLREKANQLYLSGKVDESLVIYQDLLSSAHYTKDTNPKVQSNDLQAVVAMLHYLEKYQEALIYAQKNVAIKNKDYAALTLLSSCYLFTKNISECIHYAKAAEKINRDDFSLYDIFAEAYMLENDFNNAKIAGTRALTLKDQSTNNNTVYTLPSKAKKPFNSTNKDKNIIAFSLFGNNPRYCENAVINVKEAFKIYPHWRCRFYYDAMVPQHVLDRLKRLGAQLIAKEDTQDSKDKLFWRFLVMSDTDVDYYLIRDCDSVVNTKESAAVQAWINSNKRFHIMRDFYTHGELIMAGMFGGTTDIFDNIGAMITRFTHSHHNVRTHLDQLFLRHHIWPTIKRDALIHDDYFSTDHSTPFPAHPKQASDQHIGKNEGNIAINVKIAEGYDGQQVKWCMYNTQDVAICCYYATLQDGEWSSQIPIRYVQGMQEKKYYIKSELVT